MTHFKNLLKAFLFISVFSLAFMGTECEQFLENIIIPDDTTTSSEDLLGRWQLVKQTGALQDICDGETIDFQDSTTVLLQCPQQTQITRSYWASNGILTYQTGVSYNYLIDTSSVTTKLNLTGRNVSRNLYYDKIITTEDVSKYKGIPTGRTSSEPVK